MDTLSGLQIGLLAASTAAVGAAAGWMLRSWRARVDAQAAAHEWQARAVSQHAESQALTRLNAQLSNESKTLKSQFGTATVGREAAEAALARRTQDLEAASTSLRRATAELTARDLQLDELARAAAALTPLRQALAERDQELAQSVRQRKALEERVDEMTRARARLESEAMQLGVRVESLERDLEIANAAARLVSAEHRLAATPGGAAPPPVTDQAADRRRGLETAELQARDAAAHGSLKARAERLEAVLRQLEDRDALLRAATYERDQVSRRAVEAERGQRRAIDALAEAERRIQAVEALAEERLRKTETAERKAAASMRERDEAGALARRLSLEAETLRAELRDRDGRFRALARETEAKVRELESRAAELESELYLTNTVVSGTVGGFGGNGASSEAADDLAEIESIGPDVAARLGEQGVTTFRQIAEWSAEDIDRIGPLIGVAPDSIRQHNWVDRARDAMTRADHP